MWIVDSGPPVVPQEVSDRLEEAAVAVARGDRSRESWHDLSVRLGVCRESWLSRLSAEQASQTQSLAS